MTPLGEAVHERCKTGECSITTATICTTTVAAVVALLALRGRLRLMDHSKPDNDASVQGKTGGRGRWEENVKVAKEGRNSVMQRVKEKKGKK